jgi:amidohydrolase
MKEPQFESEVKEAEQDMISWRRHLHAHPELSFREYATSDYIEAKLKEFGNIAIARPTATGVIGTIEGTMPGTRASVGIRADIDALPITEETGLDYASGQPGVMHACGHDGHTAILLAVAKILARHRDSFCGTLRLIFQPAEELPPGGAIDLKRAGAADGLDVMLALHLSSAFDTAVFGIKGGTLTANVDRFDITVHGHGGHCAFPELCADPILAAASLIETLQSIVSRKTAAADPVVISVCEVSAGTAYNIIPDEARMTASVRTFGDSTRALVQREVRAMAEHVAAAQGCTAEVQWESGYPSVENDPKLADLAEACVISRFGPEKALRIGTIMPGEDFSYFIDDKPGFFAELGTRNLEKHTDRPHHNSHYCMDEDALKYGVQYFIDMVRKLLDGTRKNIPTGSPQS